MMVRLWIVAAVAVLGVALGGCAGDPQRQRLSVAEPKTVGKMKMADGGAGEETTPDGGLECTGGMAVGGTRDYASGAKGKEAGPVEQTRLAFSGQIREGDGVGLSTTPQRGA